MLKCPSNCDNNWLDLNLGPGIRYMDQVSKYPELKFRCRNCQCEYTYNEIHNYVMKVGSGKIQRK